MRHSNPPGKFVFTSLKVVITKLGVFMSFGQSNNNDNNNKNYLNKMMNKNVHQSVFAFWMSFFNLWRCCKLNHTVYTQLYINTVICTFNLAEYWKFYCNNNETFIHYPQYSSIHCIHVFSLKRRLSVALTEINKCCGRMLMLTNETL